MFYRFLNIVEDKVKKITGRNFGTATLNGEYRLLKNICKHPKRQQMIFIDIGANIGNHTKKAIEYCERCKTPLKSLAFEPATPCFEQLEKNIRGMSIKPHTEVTLQKVAIGEKSSTGNLFYHPGVRLSGSRSLLPIYYLSTDGETVRVSSLDEHDLIQRWGFIDFIKIDVEGYELQVLKGASKLLDKGLVAYIQFEYNQTWITAKESLQIAMNFMNDKPYELYRITPLGLIKIKKYFYNLDDYCLANYLYAHIDATVPMRVVATLPLQG